MRAMLQCIEIEIVEVIMEFRFSVDKKELGKCENLNLNGTKFLPKYGKSSLSNNYFG
jgi:hypothetical protein